MLFLFIIKFVPKGTSYDPNLGNKLKPGSMLTKDDVTQMRFGANEQRTVAINWCGRLGIAV